MSRPYRSQTTEALRLLGGLVKTARKHQRLSEKALADRAGIARGTLQKIEAGDPVCSVGLVFEVATLVGLPLFASDKDPLERQNRQMEFVHALLPQRIRGEGK